MPKIQHTKCWCISSYQFILSVLACSSIHIPALYAQHPTADSAAIAQAVARANAKSDSAAVASTAARADTGRMRLGYQDLSRYNTPGYCIAATHGMESEIWRQNQRALIVPGSDQDTLPTAALTVGKRCAAHLEVSQVKPIELPYFMQLAVALNDTVMLHKVIERQLALAPTDKARGYVWLDAIDELLNATGFSLVHHPLQMTIATHFLAKLDALGKPAVEQRLAAHGHMFELFQGSQFDTTAMFRESNTIRAIGATLSKAERTQYRELLSIAWRDSLVAAYYRQDPRLVEIWRNELQHWLPEMDLTQAQVQVLTSLAEANLARVGKPAPPIQGDFWFPASASHVVPAPGKVTLVMLVKKGNGSLNSQVEQLRRFYNKYASQGLDIVLVVGTQGYSWSSPPQSASDEAKTDAWYYREYFKLPFTVVVQKTPFTTQPDGRRGAGKIAFKTTYFSRRALIGRDGRFITMVSGNESEAMLDALIQKALAAGNAPDGK
jgi:hypothetical protein